MAWTQVEDWNSIAPYMNNREYQNQTEEEWYSVANLATYKLDDVVRFKFGIRSASNRKPIALMLTLNGAYGNSPSSDHEGIVWIVIDENVIPPIAPEYQFETVEEMIAALPTGATEIGYHDGILDDGVLWRDMNALSGTEALGVYCSVEATNEKYYCCVYRGGTGVTWRWIPVRIAQVASPATATILDETCDIYFVDHQISSLLRNRYDIPYGVGWRYGVCFGSNSRHENEWDASFFIDGVLTEHLFDRTELNTRVAGEKAIYEDEFVPISQIEPGRGIQIRYRDEDGLLTGTPYYAPSQDPDEQKLKAFNVVIDTGDFLWSLGDKGQTNVASVEPGEIVTIESRGAARFVVEGQLDYAVIDSPLRLSANGEPVVPHDDVVELDFQSPSINIPENATEPVYFEISNEGAAWWSEQNDVAHPEFDPRSVVGVKGWVKPSPLDIEENGEIVNEGRVVKIEFDDQSAPPSGESSVNWQVDETSTGVVRVRGSVMTDEPVRPAIRVQWKKQQVADGVDLDNQEAICSRTDCRRAQIVSPFGIADGSLNIYGNSQVVSSGPGGFNMATGPVVGHDVNLNGGALEVTMTGRYSVSVDMFGAHIPVWADKASVLNRQIEQQLHVLKYDASYNGGKWTWYGHIGSFYFHQRNWPLGEIPDDMDTLPWGIQGSFLIHLNSGDRITFFRSARSWPGALMSMNDNNSRQFHLRNMSFNMLWHDSGSAALQDELSMDANALLTGAPDPYLFDPPINFPPKYL